MFSHLFKEMKIRTNGQVLLAFEEDTGLVSFVENEKEFSVNHGDEVLVRQIELMIVEIVEVLKNAS